MILILFSHEGQAIFSSYFLWGTGYCIVRGGEGRGSAFSKAYFFGLTGGRR